MENVGNVLELRRKGDLSLFLVVEVVMVPFDSVRLLVPQSTAEEEREEEQCGEGDPSNPSERHHSHEDTAWLVLLAPQQTVPSNL